MKINSNAIHPSRVLLPLGLSTALSLMGDTTLYTVLPTHTVEAGIALASVGVILSVNRVIRLLTNGLFGAAYDRYLRRRLFVPALFVGALSTALYAAGHAFWPLLVGRLLWGLAWSGIAVGGATIILDVTTDKDRGRWTGTYQVWWFLGSGLGAAVGGVLTDWLGYNLTMWIAVSVTILGGILVALFLPETSPTRQPIQEVEIRNPERISKDLLDVDPPSDPVGRFSTLGMVRSPAMAVALFLQTINKFAITGVLAATLALLVEQNLGTRGILLGVGTATGLLMAGRMAVSIIGAPLGGVLSDRLGNRWLVTTITTLLGMVGFFLIAGKNPVMLLLGVMVGAGASGSLQTLTSALAGDTISHKQRGRSMGIMQTSGDLGSALGPLVAYALIPLTGLSGPYLLCAGLFLLGVLVLLLVKPILTGQ